MYETIVEPVAPTTERTRPKSSTRKAIVSYILPGLCYFLLFPGRNTRYIGLLILCAGLTFMTVSLYLIFFGASLGHRRMLAAY